MAFVFFEALVRGGIWLLDYNALPENAILCNELLILSASQGEAERRVQDVPARSANAARRQKERFALLLRNVRSRISPKEVEDEFASLRINDDSRS